jgi:diguanylate cyclase
MNNPSEIAREALRQLSTQRIPPTPDNYRILYHRIAGTRDPGAPAVDAAGFDPQAGFKDIVDGLPKRSDEERRVAAEAATALEQKQWPQLTRILARAIAPRPKEPGDRWDLLLQQFILRWDANQPGLTRTQKKLALERVLKATGGSDLLFGRINTLLGQWAAGSSGDAEDAGAGAAESPAEPGATAAPAPEGTRAELRPVVADAVRELCAGILEQLVAPMLRDVPPLATETSELARKVRSTSTVAGTQDLGGALRRLAIKVEYHLEDQAELRSGLMHLLQLVIDNIGELVIDEQWLVGQMEVLRGILVEPLNVRAIDSAERRLKEVLYKQGQLKVGLADAQNSLKSMLAGFVDQLASFAESTGAYHDKIDLCARKIGEATNINQLSTVIEDVMRETRSIQQTAKQTRDDLEAARAKVAEAERKVAELEGELARASELVRHDQLTGALNRRGLEEVLDKEINRARRRESPMCIAVLDIDNFKKLNDSMGHDAGDEALVHLVKTVKEALRPQDTCARYGGEEFVVVLPDTLLEDARQVLVRVQRELTRKYFMHDNQKILITFSAGVTELPMDEDREHAIKRADELMYQAKTTGKNKVVAA